MTDVKKGTTNYSTIVRIVDSGDGTPETGVTSTTAGLNFTFHRDLAAGVLLSSTTAVALSTLGSATAAHTDGGFLHLSDGYCRLDLQDSAYATASDKVVLAGTATGMVVIGREIPLVDYDPNDGVSLGLTALPGASSTAAGGLVIKSDLSTDADIADAVWDEVLSGHASAGSGGKAVTDIETDAAAVKVVTDKFAFTVANEVDSNPQSVGGDATAAANMALQYDGTTGLTGSLFPSTQGQIGGIAVTGSANNKAFDSYVLTTGTQSANTVADVEALDGTKHEHTDTAGAMDLYYEVNIGGGTPSGVKVTGLLNNGNDDLEVYGYDWIAAAWVQIGVLGGQNSTTNNAINEYDLLISMVGTGSDFGKVRVRFTDGAFTLTTATLRIDQLLASYASATSGYANGAIWINTNKTNTNTVPNVDGTATNPVSTIAAANTLSGLLNLDRFEITPGSSITFAATQSGQVFNGTQWVLALGGQDLTDTTIIGAEVSGIGTNTNSMEFVNCSISTCTLDACHMDECGLTGTITFAEAGDFNLGRCHSQLAGSATPIIDTGAGVANVNLAMPDYSNGIEVRNLNATGTDEFSISGIGQIIYAASSSGTVNQRGIWKITNTGGVTIVTDDSADNVWDVLLTGALHNDPTSAGRRLRLTSEVVQVESAVDDPGAAATTTIFNTDLTEVDDFWNDALLVFTSGTLSGQAKPIQDYANTNGQITLDEALTSAPADNVTFSIISDHIHPVTQVADAVWSELMAGHTTAATAGAILKNQDFAARVIVEATVDTVTNGHTPTTTEFQADDITEATASHYNGRVVIFTSGALTNQATDITGYSLVGGIGQFTVTAMTEAPANNDTFVIV